MRRADRDLMVVAAQEAARKTRNRGPKRRWGTVQSTADGQATVLMDDGGTLTAVETSGGVSQGWRVRVEFDAGAVYIIGQIS